jgi:hypothetical protein
LACTGNCATCGYGSTSTCTACLAGLKPPLYLWSGGCVPDCPATTYANETTIECTKCEIPCNECISKTECTRCAEGYNLLNYDCYEVCPYGYFGVGGVCQVCTFPCEGCFNW